MNRLSQCCLAFSVLVCTWAVADTPNSDVRPVPGQRIISLAPHITELLYAVGAGDKIVGTVSHSDYPHEARDIPLIGSADKINYEAVVALNPTLVIGWQSGNGQDSLDRLKELGFRVHGHELRTLEDVAQSLVVIGGLTGRAEQGRHASQAFISRWQRLRQTYSGLQSVDLYYQLWNEPQMTINGEHLISDVIRLCGGSNIFNDSVALVPKVSIESVLVREPDVIVATGMADERPEWLDDWYQWPSIPAVKNKQLYHIHPDLLHRHSPRILDGAEQLCLALDKARRLKS